MSEQTPMSPANNEPNGSNHPQQARGKDVWEGTQAPLNVLAVISLISAFFIGLVGVICGHLSLKQIKRTGERGKGLAIGGLVVGYLNIVVWLLVIVGLIIGIGAAGKAINDEIVNQQTNQTELDDPTVEEDPQVSDPLAEGENDTGDSTGGQPATTVNPEETRSVETISEYTPEFCRLLDDVLTTIGEKGDPAAPDAQMNANELARLAAVPSPNQKKYQELAEDTSSMKLEHFQAMQTDLGACDGQ